MGPSWKSCLSLINWKIGLHFLSGIKISINCRRKIRLHELHKPNRLIELINGFKINLYIYLCYRFFCIFEIYLQIILVYYHFFWNAQTFICIKLKNNKYNECYLFVILDLRLELVSNCPLCSYVQMYIKR